MDKISFVKMHGCGNDYVYVDCLDREIYRPEELAREISPRHKGIGSDGLVLICRSELADAKMRIFNADGSEAGMCGNAIRCVGKYLYDRGIVKKLKMAIETKSGIRELELFTGDNGLAKSVSVYMGKASLAPSDIPLSIDREMVNCPVEVFGKEYRLTALSVGNPHAVCFDFDPEKVDLAAVGGYLEKCGLFPDRANIEFCRAADRHNIFMRVWERGSGETMACGTGACASAYAAVVCGLCDSDSDITVHLQGGILTIKCQSDGRIYMTGEAVEVYEGYYFRKDTENDL